MDTDSTVPPNRAATDRRGRIRFAAGFAAALMVVLLGAVLAVQIEVSDAELAATRSCGSVLDSVVDRSGWEQWWAADLDESEGVRSALVRTTRCPGAVNERVAIAAVLGVAAVAAGAAALSRRRADRSSDSTATEIERRIVRLGRLTAVLGGVLTTLGIGAVFVLVADADSTLFLYTDRLVVAVVGLIVLIPTITLFVIGRVLMLVGQNAQPTGGGRSDG